LKRKFLGVSLSWPPNLVSSLRWIIFSRRTFPFFVQKSLSFLSTDHMNSSVNVGLTENMELQNMRVSTMKV
jgi:hypothetical protein